MPYNLRLLPRSSYPNEPGSRINAPETSREAAKFMVPVAKNHRDKILAALKEAPFGLNSEQIAGQVGLTRYAVRPRVSELFASGLVERSDERTKNDAARSVVLWRAAREAA